MWKEHLVRLDVGFPSFVGGFLGAEVRGNGNRS